MAGIYGFQDFRRQRPSITPEEMAEALLSAQPDQEEEAEMEDEGMLLDNAVMQAARRAGPQQTDAGMMSGPGMYGFPR